MTDYPKYLRIALDVEIEVKDPTTARTFTFDVTADGGMLDQEPEWHLSGLVSSLLGEQLVNRTEETGIRLVSASSLPRHVAEDGSYSALVLPAMPRRLDDDTEVWPDGMEPPA